MHIIHKAVCLLSKTRKHGQQLPHGLVILQCGFYSQVAPAELEGLLLQHEDIVDAAVVGKKHDRYGELPTAFVVKKPDSHVTAEDVQQFIAGKC